jgi:hypothetical protein
MTSGFDLTGAGEATDASPPLRLVAGAVSLVTGSPDCRRHLKIATSHTVFEPAPNREMS